MGSVASVYTLFCTKLQAWLNKRGSSTHTHTHTYTYLYISNGLRLSTSKGAQLAHARMITTVVEKVQTQIIYATLPWFHGCNWYTNRQAVCKSQKKIFQMIHKQQENYIKNIKTHHNQSKRPIAMLDVQMNTALLINWANLITAR